MSWREGATLFMSLLAGFQILLYRYEGVPDIVVGSPIANRNHSDIEQLVGFFVNSLVLRTDLSRNPSFREVIAQVKNVAVDAYAHQDLPFERLVEEMHPDRSVSYNPLIQVLFALQNSPAGRFELPGLTIRSDKIDFNSTRFDLELHLYDLAEEGLSGFISYSTDLFERTTVARLAAHFSTLLEGIAANPDCSIADLEFVSKGELQQLLVEWNDTTTYYPFDSSIGVLFEIQAERTPDAVAVVMAADQLTYSDLNARANQLANHLKRAGIGLEDRVGLDSSRAIEMILGTLGILKAGGAYVPLDRNYPRHLLATMMQDTGISRVLCIDDFFESMRDSGMQPILLNKDWREISTESPSNPEGISEGQNLACLMFTSGSTGNSKAVAVLQ
ncbi:MAG: condensation domain-containing protein, partial [Blastocatellia bacterium]